MRSEETCGLAKSISALGTPELGHALDEFLHVATDFDMSCIFAYNSAAEPAVIHDGYSASVSRNALKSYLRGGYLLDPFYVASVSEAPRGLWRMGDLAPDAFFESEFAGSAEIHPCISDEVGTLSEEIGFVMDLPNGWVGTYSLMRNRISAPFDAEEFQTVSALFPVVAALVQRQWSMVYPQVDTPGAGTVESMLERTFSEQLTPAQYRVIKLILRGHSNHSIATVLHITEGTAKLHRHNAYQRLGVSSQAGLFRLFLDRLEVE